MSRHLCFYNNDTLLQDNSEPGYFTEFPVPDNTNLIVCYDDDYKITCNIRVTASSNQDMINYQYATDSALFLLKSLQNYTQNQSVRAQITVSNIAKDSNNLAQDIQNYLQNCGVSSGSSIDFSTIVTALNGISTALSALTNLSNLSNLTQLANIITAIQNKDNQSDIVDELRYIFTQNVSSNAYRSLNNVQNLSVFKSSYTSTDLSNLTRVGNSSIYTVLRQFASLFSQVNYTITNQESFTSLNNKILQRLLRCFTTAVSNDNFAEVSSKSFLSNIETKLEQNLPFTTIVENDIVETNVAQNCSYGSKIEQIPFSE